MLCRSNSDAHRLVPLCLMISFGARFEAALRRDVRRIDPGWLDLCRRWDKQVTQGHPKDFRKKMSDINSNDMTAEIIRLNDELAQLQEGRRADALEAQRVSQRLRQFEAMLDLVPVGVVLADSDGQIILGNSRVEEMVRHPVLHSEDVDSYGEWISFHADGRRVESHEYPLSRVIRDGEDESSIDVHYQRGDGSRFWMRVVGRPVTDEDGNRTGAAVALIDIEEERRLANQQKVLIGELNHRVKNAFTVVKSIVSQSLRKGNVPLGLRQTIDERLDAYSQAHAKLVSSTWDHALVGTLARDVVAPIAGDRARIEGPVVDLPSRQALALSMAFYELATNALKHGSLSIPEGRVDLIWAIDADGDNKRLTVNWVEKYGPPATEPGEKGFGSFIIDRALAMETGGQVEADYGTEGFRWQLAMALQNESENLKGQT
jgi:PAS domain S-box-containing protein